MSVSGFKVNGVVEKYNYPDLDNIAVATADIENGAVTDIKLDPNGVRRVSENLQYLYNEDNGFVNYGYDTDYSDEPVSGANNSTAIGVKRHGVYVKLNGTFGDTQSWAGIRLNGTIARATSAGALRTWTTGGIALTEGHLYSFSIKKIGGTATQMPESRVFLAGSSEDVGSRKESVDAVSSGQYFKVTSASDTYNFAIRVAANTTFTNAEFIVTLQDTTVYSESFTYLDQCENSRDNYINYGYPEKKVVYRRTPGATDANVVGVEQFGTFVTITLTEDIGTNAYRVRLTGGLARTSSGATARTWPGALQLTENKKYHAIIKAVSGIHTINDGVSIPTISIYPEGTSNTIGTMISSENGVNTYEFTAGSTPINMVLYISGGVVNYVNAKFQILLKEPTESVIYDGVDSYYENELNDTLQKVRDAETSPAIKFLWATDIHRYSSTAGKQTFSSMINNMKEIVKNTPIDFILNTGDLTDGNKTQSETLSKAYDCLKDFMSIGVPYVFAMGNHDTNYKGGSNQAYLFTMDECVKAYFTATHRTSYNANEKGTDYYIDFNDVNVRFIVLNANNKDSNTANWYTFGNTTATWLESVLDTNKKVVVALHQPPQSAYTYNLQSTDKSGAIVTALQTFVNNGGSLLMLTGHSHRDVAFINPWINIGSDAAKYVASEGEYTTPDSEENPTKITGYIDTITKPVREADTYTEDCWNVCVYKPDENVIDVIRFGGGSDRCFHINPIIPTTLTTKLSGTITWSSSDTAVATVSNGAVTGVASGRCAIIAKDTNLNYECWVISVS